MLPSFLIPESVVRDDAEGPEISLGSSHGKLLLLTLGITRIIEQESVDVAIFGSADRENWAAKPVIAFPQKFYCGTYQLLLDLRERTDIQFLRAKCKVQRWGRGEPKPLFGLFLFVQEAEEQVMAKTA